MTGGNGFKRQKVFGAGGGKGKVVMLTIIERIQVKGQHDIVKFKK